MTQMPLAFTGATPQTRHASYLAAVAAEESAPGQRERLYAWLKARGNQGGDDWEAHEALSIPRASLCLRRRELRLAGRIRPTGEFRKHGPRRLKFTVWRAL